MSKRELDRLELIRRIQRKELSVVAAAELMSLSRSQVHRLMSGYRERGASALISTPTRQAKQPDAAGPSA